MAESIREQLVKQGVVDKAETHEAKKAAAQAALPPTEAKGLPPSFEVAARGVIGAPRAFTPVAARVCHECGAVLPARSRAANSADGKARCAECAADD